MVHKENFKNLSKKIGKRERLTDGKLTGVYLDSLSKDFAKVLGGGNVSQGIRKALKIAIEIERGDSDGCND